jgi:hypothetical protein
MMENTVLSIDKLAAADTGADIVTDTQLDLRSGRIFGTVKKLTGGSRYEVKIPNGVAGVRGTIYFLTALGDCSVWKGAVALALSIGDEVRTMLVTANKHYDASEDVLTDLNSSQTQELRRMINTSGTTGGGPPAPIPPKDPDLDPYLEPTAGYPETSPNTGGGGGDGD